MSQYYNQPPYNQPNPPHGWPPVDDDQSQSTTGQASGTPGHSTGPYGYYYAPYGQYHSPYGQTPPPYGQYGPPPYGQYGPPPPPYGQYSQPYILPPAPTVFWPESPYTNKDYVYTPRGAYRQANFWERFGASAIDGILTMFIIFGALILGLAMSDGPTRYSRYYGYYTSFNPVPMLILLFLAVAATFLYYVLPTAKTGQTLGKKALGIKVIKNTGETPTLGLSFMRYFFGYNISSSVFYLGFLWMLWDTKAQTWHDKIFNTYVVKS